MKTYCIALTGGMGSGKSTAAQVFQELDVRVVDADKLAHIALDTDESVKSAVREIFGDVYQNGKADRKTIAKMAFANSAKLEKLEQILHPVVEKMWQSEAKTNEIVVVEVPLLFEKRLENKFDLCLSVYCSEQLRQWRLKVRGMSPTEITARDSFQMPPQKKAELADIVLFNESSFEFLKEQAAKVLSRLKK